MNTLERSGLETIQKIGLTAFGELGHVQVLKVRPNAAVDVGQNFEFDYFVLYGTMCLVGEMSGTGGEQHIKEKYKRFRNNYMMLTAGFDVSVFDHFNIPDDERYLFEQVIEFRAFFIAHEHEKFDVQFPPVPNIAIIYQRDWETIKQYAEFMGEYAKGPFLKLAGIRLAQGMGKALRIKGAENSLVHIGGRTIATGVNSKVDVFTFIAHPADLLPIAEVFRRELLPIVAVDNDDNYQRPLDLNKLRSMQQLVNSSNFMFPNSILITLNENCYYDRAQKILDIPMVSGAVSVIDGQHRLFSYASNEISLQIREKASILVTAISFPRISNRLSLQHSARTFIEINQAQKKISSDHIDEIAYSVLGDSYARALAAQVILRCNQHYRKPLHGLFRSSRTTGGVFRAATVIGDLAHITDLKIIKKLVNGNSKASEGYCNLFEVQSIGDLATPDTMISQGVICLEKYFGAVKRVFTKDWPERGANKGSTLEYTKVLSGFVRLLGQFIKEGMNWEQVEEQLKTIRANVLKKRGLGESTQNLVFPKNDQLVPDDSQSISATFIFLNTNRQNPTSIQEVRQLRSRSNLHSSA